MTNSHDVKSIAIATTKKLKDLIDKLAEQANPQQEALKEFTEQVERFMVLVSAHETHSPWVAAWYHFRKHMEEGLTKGVRVALLIEALHKECPALPRVSSTVPRAIVSSVLNGETIYDPIVKHKVSKFIEGK